MTELIGAARCPFCDSEKARLTLSKARLPVLTCNNCNTQTFARSDRSDEHLRRRLIAAPAAESAQLPPAPVISENEPAPVPKAAKADKRRGADWSPF